MSRSRCLSHSPSLPLLHFIAQKKSLRTETLLNCNSCISILRLCPLSPHSPNWGSSPSRSALPLSLPSSHYISCLSICLVVSPFDRQTAYQVTWRKHMTTCSSFCLLAIPALAKLASCFASLRMPSIPHSSPLLVLLVVFVFHSNPYVTFIFVRNRFQDSNHRVGWQKDKASNLGHGRPRALSNHHDRLLSRGYGHPPCVRLHQRKFSWVLACSPECI